VIEVGYGRLQQLGVSFFSELVVGLGDFSVLTPKAAVNELPRMEDGIVVLPE